ncbi:MAG: hypothetical protein KC618_02565 [Candidatus Omnitrophica bacterium]|nr:hypothetical protein [Candidatus Omnitrophota bacterium]
MIRKLVLFSFFLLLCSGSFAETVVLESGETITAPVINITQDYLNRYGLQKKHFLKFDNLTLYFRERDKETLLDVYVFHEHDPSYLTRAAAAVTTPLPSEKHKQLLMKLMNGAANHVDENEPEKVFNFKTYFIKCLFETDDNFNKIEEDTPNT